MLALSSDSPTLIKPLIKQLFPIYTRDIFPRQHPENIPTVQQHPASSGNKVRASEDCPSQETSSIQSRQSPARRKLPHTHTNMCEGMHEIPMAVLAGNGNKCRLAPRKLFHFTRAVSLEIATRSWIFLPSTPLGTNTSAMLLLLPGQVRFVSSSSLSLYI